MTKENFLTTQNLLQDVGKYRKRIIKSVKKEKKERLKMIFESLKVPRTLQHIKIGIIN